MILGADHSHYDWRGWDALTGGYYYVPIDFVSSQARFVFLKACDGKYDTPFYQNAMADARKAGKYAAPYVWLYARNHTDPKVQADFWYSRLKDEPLIAIDFESYGDSFPNYDDLYNAIERLKADGYKGKIIIYTGHYYWLAYGSTASYWTQYPVWLARYSSTPPQATPPFAKEIIWQFSATGSPAKYGVTNGKMAIDENWFYGTEAELADLFGAPTQPPTTGEPMYKITITWEAGSNVRSVPSAASSATIIRTLKDNAVVESAEEPINNAEGTWYKISDGYICTVYYGSVRATVEMITEPPATGSVKVEMYANGALVHSKDVAAGGSVRIDIAD